jgi:hypothetical protein
MICTDEPKQKYLSCQEFGRRSFACLHAAARPTKDDRSDLGMRLARGDVKRAHHLHVRHQGPREGTVGEHACA